MASNTAAEKAMVAGGRFSPGMKGRDDEDAFANMIDRSFLTTKE
jgi:hypothetical protein